MLKSATCQQRITPCPTPTRIELEKFSQLAHKWWDKNSEFKPLHEINPLRLGYIDRIAALSGKTVLDVGCGGGILAESMAASGATVTGIDLADKSLQVAKLHLLESGRRWNTAKSRWKIWPPSSPAITTSSPAWKCWNMCPTRPPWSRACAHLVKPGGHVFFSTLNRNPKSYLFAMLGAEYVLNLLPRGTHDFAKFIKPSELAQCVPRCRAERCRHHRHELQPAEQELFAGARHQRQLHGGLPTWLRPSSSISTAPSPTTAPDLGAALNHVRALRDLPPLPIETIAPAGFARLAADCLNWA